MSTIAIRCDGLAKQYRIGERERYKALREVVTDAITSPFRRARSVLNGSNDGHQEESMIWAMRDVSFEIHRGEAVGIIGRNGAGKSTLLKILSRITDPTRGQADISGRVGSLLEIGTGFHPELSGRDNIYLNGAILGMKRNEIARKFDEIVAFSEVEKFIDTPVKRYSSGMYVRLAFAVAAHLETEILIVDEVLAVGDAEFQKKCLGKMGEVARHDRTVLFVSHNVASVRALSTSSLLLQEGYVSASGEVATVISSYMAHGPAPSTTYQRTKTRSCPSIARARLSQPCANECSTEPFRIDQPIFLEVEIDNPDRKPVSVNVHIYDDLGNNTFHFSDEFGSDTIFKINNRLCTFPPYAFNSGSYQLKIVLLERNVQLFDVVDSALSFTIEKAGKVFDRITGDWLGTNGPGLFQWQ